MSFRSAAPAHRRAPTPDAVSARYPTDPDSLPEPEESECPDLYGQCLALLDGRPSRLGDGPRRQYGTA